MRNEINLTDEQIADAFDQLGAGVTVDDVILTRETFEQIREARKSWALCGKGAEKPEALVFKGVQTRRGVPCCNFYAVDFGAVRGVVMA
jgi:hypothetical protein